MTAKTIGMSPSSLYRMMFGEDELGQALVRMCKEESEELDVDLEEIRSFVCREIERIERRALESFEDAMWLALSRPKKDYKVIEAEICEEKIEKITDRGRMRP